MVDSSTTKRILTWFEAELRQSCSQRPYDTVIAAEQRSLASGEEADARTGWWVIYQLEDVLRQTTAFRS